MTNNFSDSTKPPRISIITVCRNSSVTIAQTFESVLSQQFNDMEYIIIDGASTDGTLEIIHRYHDRFDQQGILVKVVSEPDQGIYDAMNKGISLCCGDLIGILNSDDQYEPDALNKIHQAACAHPKIGIFYGFLRLVFCGQELSIYRYNYDLILSDLSAEIQSAAQHPTCFVRCGVYEKIGLFNSSYRLAADYDFLLRAKRLEVRFLALDIVITTFNSGGASYTTPLQVKFEERYRAQFVNNLIDEREYKAQLRKLRGSPLRRLIRALMPATR